MTFLVWRQHRRQLAIATVLIAGLAVLLLVSGSIMAGDYSAALRSCGATGSCGSLGDALFQNDKALFVVVSLTIAVPVLLGLFWGAPLVAKEIEEGTHQLAWTQAVPRVRWLAVKLGYVLLAAAVWAGAVSALVTWWSGPLNSLHQYRFDLGHFDTQGLVPVGYALFAVAVGITSGVLLRRTMPALAATLTVFIGTRIAVDYGLRRHYLPASSASAPLGAPLSLPPGSNWVVSDDFVTPAGQVTQSLHFTPGTIPASCRNLAPDPHAVMTCLGQHGFRHLVTYQPAARYWPFQLIETGLYAGLATALVGLALWLVTRRDA